MDYFDKQDSNKAQESYNHNQQDPYHMPKTAFPDNWKVPQDGDFDFVSRSKSVMGILSRFYVKNSNMYLHINKVTRVMQTQTQLVFQYFVWNGSK